MIIYLIRLSPDARDACASRDATIPGDLWRTGYPSPVCLAPHGVFPASRLAARAVSSYLAFSPLPNERLRIRRAVFFL